MSQVLHQFAKNATEEVRVSLTEYKGHKLIDLRIYYEPEDGEDRRPTKKGITIDVGLYPELKKAMFMIEKELLKQNLVEKEALEEIVNE
jgi:Transcriptional Coactivator p15 (PC4)